MPKSKKVDTEREEKSKKKNKAPKIPRVIVNIRKPKGREDTVFIAYGNDTLREFLKRYKKELGDLESFNVVLKEGNNDKIIERFDFSDKKEVYFTLRTKKTKKTDSD